MDSYALRQEQSELLKSVAELKKTLETGESRNKELHNEYMEYLKDIPVYKKQAEEGRAAVKETSQRIAELRVSLSALDDQIKQSNKDLAEAQSGMQEIRANSQIILDKIQEEKEQSRKRVLDAKSREVVASGREKELDERKVALDMRDKETDQRESLILALEEESKIKNGELSKKIDAHNLGVTIHANKVDDLIQSKELHAQEEQILANKSMKVEKIIKDNIELKASLLLQSEKLSKEITITQGKQVSLDRALADLVNQENALRIKELKIKKMAHDAGLEKELKALEASLK